MWWPGPAPSSASRNAGTFTTSSCALHRVQCLCCCPPSGITTSPARQAEFLDLGAISGLKTAPRPENSGPRPASFSGLGVLGRWRKLQRHRTRLRISRILPRANIPYHMLAPGPRRSLATPSPRAPPLSRPKTIVAHAPRRWLQRRHASHASPLSREASLMSVGRPPRLRFCACGYALEAHVAQHARSDATRGRVGCGG